MQQINNITIEARAGKDGRRVAGNLVVFSVVKDFYKKKPNPISEAREDKYTITTVWFDVLCFDDKNGDNLGLNVVKGKNYEISGRFGAKTYNEKIQFEIIADHIKEIAPKTPQQEVKRPKQVEMSALDDDEMPF